MSDPASRDELAFVRTTLARALKQNPPDLASLNAALQRVDTLLARSDSRPANAATAAPRATRPAERPVARGFFAG